MDEATSMMCAVCGRILDLHVGLGWTHTKLDEPTADHPAVPVPAHTVPVVGRCDFCSQDNPTHYLESVPITVVAEAVDGATEPKSGYDAEYACCSECARLIDSGRWKQVTRRALKVLADQAEEVTPEMEEALGQLHTLIRKNMVHGPRPLPT